MVTLKRAFYTMPGARFRSKSLGSFSCTEEARLVALLTRREGRRKRQVGGFVLFWIVY